MGTPTSWDDALDDLAAIVRDATASNGPDAVGGYLATGLAYDISGWMTAERFLRRLGTRQRYTPVTVDNAPVLRAAELVTGTSELNTVWEPDRSKLLLLFGTNPVVSHGYGTTLADPVARIREFRAAGGAVWVLDPRRTETAAQADHHLAVRPGSDHLVLAWLVRELLADGADRVELETHCDAADVAALAARARAVRPPSGRRPGGPRRRRAAQPARGGPGWRPPGGDVRHRGDHEPRRRRGGVAALGPSDRHGVGGPGRGDALQPGVALPARHTAVAR